LLLLRGAEAPLFHGPPNPANVPPFHRPLNAGETFDASTAERVHSQIILKY